MIIIIIQQNYLANIFGNIFIVTLYIPMKIHLSYFEQFVSCLNAPFSMNDLHSTAAAYTEGNCYIIALYIKEKKNLRIDNSLSYDVQ